MKTAVWSYILIHMLFVFLGCDEQKDCCPTEEAGQFTGSWLLYEHGYSPGVGYITEAVPSRPKQVLLFEEGDRMTSTLNGFERYRFYKIREDTVTDTQFVALYANDPDVPGAPLESNQPTYSFDLKGDTLKLYFRYCIEGCHLAFRKL